jgi:tRNA-uridine 2-sulfurtransferase
LGSHYILDAQIFDSDPFCHDFGEVLRLQLPYLLLFACFLLFIAIIGFVKKIIADNKKLKIAVGMSGGVDSSVAAYLLKEQGYDVTGVYMQCWNSRADGCKADEDRSDAVAVASKLCLKFETLNFIKEYKEKVIEYFYKEYEAGRTPNPDVMCNKEIKFGMFLQWALKNGYDKVATGHYARVEKIGDSYKLLKGLDESKDQSYFLYLLNQEQLSKTLFPVGEMRKKDLRILANKAGLPTFNKPDSVGICFIGEVDIREFLKKRLKEKQGNVVNKDGEVLGSHDGIQFYTIGQRHGFKLIKYVGLPMYVVGKNVERNELVVGFVGDANKDKFEATDLHWIGGVPETRFTCDIRIRHLGELHEANVALNQTVAFVELKDPVFGVAPGQSVVFYIGDVLIGGGIISC